MLVFLVIGGVGFLMLVLTWFLGELFDLGHGLADMLGGHGEVALGDHSMEHGPSPLSSRVVFTFMTAFGGGGAIASSYGLSTLASVGAGIGAGLLLGGAIYGITLAVFRQQSSSGFDLGSLVGRSARVVVSIPSGGAGQVSVGAGAGTSTLLARSHDGSAVPLDRVVRVVEVQGDLLLVEPLAATPPDKQA